jgi:hypothetical protein
VGEVEKVVDRCYLFIVDVVPDACVIEAIGLERVACPIELELSDHGALVARDVVVEERELDPGWHLTVRRTHAKELLRPRCWACRTGRTRGRSVEEALLQRRKLCVCKSSSSM